MAHIRSLRNRILRLLGVATQSKAKAQAAKSSVTKSKSNNQTVQQKAIKTKDKASAIQSHVTNTNDQTVPSYTTKSSNEVDTTPRSTATKPSNQAAPSTTTKPHDDVQTTSQSTTTKPNNEKKAIFLLLFHHNPFRDPYQPPPWNQRQKPTWRMSFNDDEEREYYEGIPVPETDEWYEMPQEHQAQAWHLRQLGKKAAQEERDKATKVRQDLGLLPEKPKSDTNIAQVLKNLRELKASRTVWPPTAMSLRNREYLPEVVKSSTTIPAPQAIQSSTTIPAPQVMSHHDKEQVPEMSKSSMLIATPQAMFHQGSGQSVTTESSATIQSSVTSGSGTSSRFRPKLPHNASSTNTERSQRLQNRGLKVFGDEEARFPDFSFTTETSTPLAE